MKMRMVLVPESSEYFHVLTRPSARENLIEFCSRQSFKTYYYFFFRFSKNTQILNLVEIRSVRTELFREDGWTDGKADRHDEANSRLLQFRERV